MSSTPEYQVVKNAVKASWKKVSTHRDHNSENKSQEYFNLLRDLRAWMSVEESMWHDQDKVANTSQSSEDSDTEPEDIFFDFDR